MLDLPLGLGYKARWNQWEWNPFFSVLLGYEMFQDTHVYRGWTSTEKQFAGGYRTGMDLKYRLEDWQVGMTAIWTGHFMENGYLSMFSSSRMKVDQPLLLLLSPDDLMGILLGSSIRKDRGLRDFQLECYVQRRFSFP
jgi:hypothetical protein